MARHTITLIPGDGVGPEISEAARRAIDASGVDIEWENTEDLYGGIVFEEGSEDALRLIAVIGELGDHKQIRKDSGISIKPISITGTRRVFRFAFTWPKANGRRKVTAVHKANIMKHTDGLWLRTAEDVATEFPDVEFEDRIVDNMAMQLVQKPELYDVMVMPNLYGDILSD